MKRRISASLLWSAALVLSPVVVAPFGTASFGTATAWAAPSSGLPAGVAAQVNGENIMRADLDRLVNSQRDRESALKTGSDAARATLDSMRTHILDNLIQQRLLYQESQRLKITPKRDAIDKRMLEIKSSLSEEQFKRMLADSGKTAADFRQRVVEALAIEELSRRVSADIVVPESDIAGYYRDNSDLFEVQTARAHHILLALAPNASPAERARQYKLAQSLARQAQQRGANFAALARANSQDPYAKQTGGDLGTFSPQDMEPTFSAAVFDPKNIVGKVMNKIVETEFGFHVVLIDERKTTTIPLAQARDLIQARLLEKRIKARLESRLQQLRSAASIKRFDA